MPPAQPWPAPPVVQPQQMPPAQPWPPQPQPMPQAQPWPPQYQQMPPAQPWPPQYQYAPVPPYSPEESYRKLGGWLLVLFIYFCVGIFGQLTSAITYFIYSPILSFASLVALVLTVTLVCLIATKNKGYLVAFYCYAAMQLATVAVALSVMPKLINTMLGPQLDELSTLYAGLGINNYVALYDHIFVGAMIFGLVIAVGEYIAMWFYFRRSKRVATYFGAKPAA